VAVATDDTTRLDELLSVWGRERRLPADQAEALRQGIKALASPELDPGWWRAVLANPLLGVARAAGVAWQQPPASFPAEV
jgi:hypothetical protein